MPLREQQPRELEFQFRSSKLTTQKLLFHIPFLFLHSFEYRPSILAIETATTMTIVQTEDNRNQEWRNSNVGSKLLAKMGWTEGSGIGKRNVNTTALRAVKRQEGLNGKER